VGDAEDGCAGVVEIPKQVEDFDLVADVEVAVGFIEKQERWFLSEPPSDDGALAFAAGELDDTPVLQVEKIGPPQGFTGDGDVLFARALQAAKVGRSAHQDHFEYGKPKLKRRVLGDDGNLPGDVSALKGSDVDAVQRDGSPYRTQDTGETAQERALPAAVGANEADEVTTVEFEGDVVDDRVAVVADGE